MNGFEHATPGVLVLLLVVLSPVVYYLRKTRKGGTLFIRRMPGIDAIDEGLGRAAELGRPVVFSTGLTSLGPVLMACLGVLHYIAKKGARYKLPLMAPQNDPTVMAVVESTMQDAYRDAKRESTFDPKQVVFLSDDQFAYAAGYMGLVQREKIGAAFLFGTFAAEALILAEAGQQVGAMQVAGSVLPEQIPFFICTCDYTLIGEELYAASAYLTQEPVQLGSLYGQDRAKLVFVAIIIIGVTIATINSLLGTTITNIDAIISSDY